MNRYPTPANDDNQSIYNTLLFISRERDKDIIAFNRLPSIYAEGRKVGKIPTTSADVVVADRIGDFNITDSYRYDLVDDGSGGAVWVRTTVDNSW